MTTTSTQPTLCSTTVSTDSATTDAHPAPEHPELDPRAKEAFASLRSRLEAIDPKEFVALNVDPLTAVGIVLAAAPRLQTLEPCIAKMAPTFDLGLLHAASSYALAFAHAHVMHVGTNTSPDALARLTERSGPARRTLLLWVDALADRGLADGSKLAEIRSGQGYRDEAEDILRLVDILRRSWEAIRGHIPLDEAEIDEAEAVALKMLAAINAREMAALDAAETVRLRNAAFTLLFNTWDQIRRVVQYVRWDQGDAEKFAPSFFVRGPRRPADDGASKSPGDTPTTPAAPPSAPPNTSAPAPAPNPGEPIAPTSPPAVAAQPANGPGLRPFIT